MSTTGLQRSIASRGLMHTGVSSMITLLESCRNPPHSSRCSHPKPIRQCPALLGLWSAPSASGPARAHHDNQWHVCLRAARQCPCLVVALPCPQCMSSSMACLLVRETQAKDGGGAVAKKLPGKAASQQLPLAFKQWAADAREMMTMTLADCAMAGLPSFWMHRWMDGCRKERTLRTWVRQCYPVVRRESGTGDRQADRGALDREADMLHMCFSALRLRSCRRCT